MSKKRQPQYHPDWKASSKGPNGRGLCKWCLTEVPKGSRTWCSQRCVDEYTSRRPGELRRAARKRDKGICQACGLDTVAFRRFLDSLPLKACMVLKKALKVTHRNTLWDADHIVPVSEGGGGCDASNIQLLCVWCNRAKTAEMPRKKPKNQNIKKNRDRR